MMTPNADLEVYRLYVHWFVAVDETERKIAVKVFDLFDLVEYHPILDYRASNLTVRDS